MALAASGEADAASLIDRAVERAGAVKLKTVLTALAVAWGLYVIPALWLGGAGLVKFAAVPLAGAVATLAVVMAAAPAGVAAAYLAGQIAAAGYLAVTAFYAQKRQ